MYNHNKAQQSKNRVHISWDILYNDSIILLNRGLDYDFRGEVPFLATDIKKYRKHNCVDQ